MLRENHETFPVTAWGSLRRDIDSWHNRCHFVAGSWWLVTLHRWCENRSMLTIVGPSWVTLFIFRGKHNHTVEYCGQYSIIWIIWFVSWMLNHGVLSQQLTCAILRRVWAQQYQAARWTEHVIGCRPFSDTINHYETTVIIVSGHHCWPLVSNTCY